MRRRAGIFALLIFQSLWLNVIVPGHTRGVITLPGWSSRADHSCCSTHGERSRSDEKSPQPDGRAAHCAICFFAARLTLPQTIDLTPAPLELLETREVPRLATRGDASFPPVYFGRAPPIV